MNSSDLCNAYNVITLPIDLFYECFFHKILRIYYTSKIIITRSPFIVNPPRQKFYLNECLNLWDFFVIFHLLDDYSSYRNLFYDRRIFCNILSGSDYHTFIYILLFDRDRFYFNSNIFWKLCNLYTGSCRIRCHKIVFINSIDLCKIIHIFNKYNCFYYFFHRRS